MRTTSHPETKMADCLKVALFVLLLFSIHGTDAGKKKKNSGVKITIESRPSDCTEEAAKGDTVRVHYTGSLENGQVFDTSKREGREPLSVTLGNKQVIPGWEEGLLGMCEGEERKLVIQPHLAYGSRGVEGIIPRESHEKHPSADSVLIFHVELLSLEKPSLLRMPSGSTNTTLFTVIGVIVVIGLLGYELYKRYNNDTKKTSPTTTRKKRGKKR